MLKQPDKIIKLSPNDIQICLPTKNAESNKSTSGRLKIIAGSFNMRGAALLCARAAMKSGCGYVTLASVEKVTDAVILQSPEVLTQSLPQNSLGGISGIAAGEIVKDTVSAYAVGCGMGDSDDTLTIVKSLLLHAECPIVIDADGLNVIARDLSVLKTKKSAVILTPHTGEFSRLVDTDVKDIEENKEAYAMDFARKYEVTVLLKGSKTVIADAKGNVYVTETGVPGMAKAGSGDALTGLLGGFAAYGLPPVAAAYCGAFIHGAAGALAQEKHSALAMCAGDTINEIGNVFLSLSR